MRWVVIYFGFIKYANVKVVSGLRPSINLDCIKVVYSDDNLKPLACELLTNNLGKRKEELLSQCFAYSVVERLTGELLASFYFVGCPGEGSLHDSIVEIIKQHEPVINESKNVVSGNKQRVIIKLTALGFSPKEISKALHLTPRGVEYHIQTAKMSLGANNKSNLVYLAAKQGWLQLI